MTPLRILSFGAGVQSTTLLMLSLAGDLGPLDAVIFADTGYEPRAVYEHLERCKKLCEKNGVAFIQTRYRDLRADLLEAADRQARGEKGGMRATYQVPLYSRPVAASAKAPPSMMRRFCTTNYKVHGINKAINALRKKNAVDGARPDVEVWLGISLDEIERMKANPPRKPWFRYRHPLAWELRWTRAHCLAWYDARDLPRPPPKRLHLLPLPIKRRVARYPRGPRGVGERCGTRSIHQNTH